MQHDNKMFNVLNKIKKITKIKYIQSCLKFLKKDQFKYKLKLKGGGAKKKKAKLDLIDSDQEESPNMKNLNEMRSNRTDTIMNSQNTQKKPVVDMEETAETKRQEKKAEKKYDVDLDKMTEYLDNYETLT